MGGGHHLRICARRQPPTVSGLKSSIALAFYSLARLDFRAGLQKTLGGRRFLALLTHLFERLLP